MSPRIFLLEQGHGRPPTASVATAFKALGALLLVVLAGCPLFGDDPNTPPIARAVVDRPLLDLGETVTLDGSGSEDPDGKDEKLEFTWELTAMPSGSMCSIMTATSAVASLQPDMPGQYQINLTVSDGKDVDAASVQVMVNGPPVAVASSSHTDVPVGQSVLLDGSGSHDPNGDPLTYAWSFYSKPSGSAALLSGASSSSPSFTPDKGGPYVVELVVSDGRMDSDPVHLTVTANAPPVADAGDDETVWVGDFVALDGSGSYDPDGDALSYDWSFASRPGGSTATLANATTKTPAFTPDTDGNFVVSLVVSDGKASSDVDRVTIIAKRNSPPVADAGSYSVQTVGQIVHLDGSGSYDPDGDDLTYAWSLTSKPSGSGAQLANASSSHPTFTPDVGGSYQVRLIVNDGRADSDPAHVTILVNTPPEADAGPNQTVKIGSQVTMDGTGSSDADGDAITYAWSFSSRPAGSSAHFANPSAARPTFHADVEGKYVIRLVVNDGLAASQPDYATITAQNSGPVAEAGPDQRVDMGTLVHLNGSGSSDPDGDPISFAWTLESQPSGSSATLSDPTTATPTFTPMAFGEYVAQLIVQDPWESSSPDYVTVNSTNRPGNYAGTTSQYGRNITFEVSNTGTRVSGGLEIELRASYPCSGTVTVTLYASMAIENGVFSFDDGEFSISGTASSATYFAGSARLEGFQIGYPCASTSATWTATWASAGSASPAMLPKEVDPARPYVLEYVKGGGDQH